MQREASRIYHSACGILRSGTGEDLESLALNVQGFPGGIDPYMEEPWIIHAIDDGSLHAIKWILSKGVDLTLRDGEGYTAVHCVIESRRSDKYEILALLLQNRAPVNARGLNDWTPAHLAAARDDVEALRILVAHGADLSICTREAYSPTHETLTPLEEARELNAQRAIEFLEKVLRERPQSIARDGENGNP